jgi:hypothetical protein
MLLTFGLEGCIDEIISARSMKSEALWERLDVVKMK